MLAGLDTKRVRRRPFRFDVGECCLPETVRMHKPGLQWSCKQKQVPPLRSLRSTPVGMTNFISAALDVKRARRRPSRLDVGEVESIELRP